MRSATGSDFMYEEFYNFTGRFSPGSCLEPASTCQLKDWMKTVTEKNKNALLEKFESNISNTQQGSV